MSDRNVRLSVLVSRLTLIRSFRSVALSAVQKWSVTNVTYVTFAILSRLAPPRVGNDEGGRVPMPDRRRYVRIRRSQEEFSCDQ